MRFSPGVPDDAELEVEFHPDVVGGEPGTGAVKVVRVGQEEWTLLPHLDLPEVGRLSELEYMPSVRDELYCDTYGPYWYFAAINMLSAAYSMGCLVPERLPGALRFLSENLELQQTIAAAKRIGVPPIEMFAILEEKL